MEEFKNGAISEEALEKIAGGLNLPPLTVRNVLIAAGVVVGALSAVGGATLTGYEIYKHKKGKENKSKTKAKPTDYTGIGDLKKVDMKQFRNLFKEDNN